VDHKREICVRLIGEVRLHREGLAALLVNDGRLRVADGGRASRPVDVVVLDTVAHDGPQSIQRVVAEVDEPVVALGVPDGEQDVLAIAESGVLGFVERDASIDELVGSVQSAARGEASFPPRVATALLRRVSSPTAVRRPAPGLAPLTIRERQIVDLIGEALSNKEIATRLGIEVATVKNHVHNILEKLDVSRRTDAVARLRVVESGAPADPQGVTYMDRSRVG
jgi:two-component system, NarL family, nitrate/nitrite response regulator NarL